MRDQPPQETQICTPENRLQNTKCKQEFIPAASFTLRTDMLSLQRQMHHLHASSIHCSPVDPTMRGIPPCFKDGRISLHHAPAVLRSQGWNPGNSSPLLLKTKQEKTKPNSYSGACFHHRMKKKKKSAYFSSGRDYISCIRLKVVVKWGSAHGCSSTGFCFNK